MSLILVDAEYLLEKIEPYDVVRNSKSASDWVKQKLALVRIWFGGKCFHCDKIYDLQFAHVLPTKLSSKGRGQAHRLYDILKHPASYMLLCEECHRKYDKKDEDIPGIPNLFGIKLREFLEC